MSKFHNAHNKRCEVNWYIENRTLLCPVLVQMMPTSDQAGQNIYVRFSVEAKAVKVPLMFLLIMAVWVERVGREIRKKCIIINATGIRFPPEYKSIGIVNYRS